MQKMKSSIVLRRRFSWLAFSLAISISGSVVASDVVNADAVLRRFDETLIKTKDLSSAAREFATGKLNIRNPGYVKGDLDGDGVEDVLLLTKNPKSGEVNARIFLCAKSCKQKRTEVVGAVGDVFLQEVPVGTTLGQSQSLPGKDRSVRLKSPAVKVLNFGKSEIVYYWDAKRKSFRTVTTAD